MDLLYEIQDLCFNKFTEDFTLKELIRDLFLRTFYDLSQ